VGGRRRARTPGFDCTFSAPKSVSLLWALGSPEVSRQVRDAHDAAVVQHRAEILSGDLAAQHAAHGLRAEQSPLATARRQQFLVQVLHLEGRQRQPAGPPAPARGRRLGDREVLLGD
jgi:hypothetical protein